jgi:mannose-6-phosphate isomerase-like protein (cupin superfamily)
MASPKQIPSVVPPGAGRKLTVIGLEITLLLDCAQTGGAYYTFIGVLPPGTGVPPHVHQHEDEVVHILEGEFEVFLDGKVHRASAGAMLYFPRHVPHGFTVVGKSTGRAFFVISPGGNFERFFTELSALPANQPPDMAKVVEIFGRYDIQFLPKPA